MIEPITSTFIFFINRILIRYSRPKIVELRHIFKECISYDFFCHSGDKKVNIHLIFSAFPFSPTSLLASIRVSVFSLRYLLHIEIDLHRKNRSASDVSYLISVPHGFPDLPNGIF
jgi:hypothetical protein